MADGDRPRPPVAPKRPHAQTHHGIAREDPYAWLRVDNWQQVMREPDALAADVRELLEAENAYTEAILGGTDPLRATLFEEFRGRIKENDASVPAPDGAFAYSFRYETGGQHPLYCRRPRGGDDASEQIVFNADEAAKGQAYFHLGGVTHSPDHRLLAYGVDTKGSEYYTVRFRDMENGAERPERIDNCAGGVVWAPDGEHVFYTQLDDNHRPNKVFRRRLGADPSDDVLVYEEKDAGFFVGISLTENRGHICVHSHDHTTSEYWVIDAKRPSSAPRRIAKRQRGVEYSLSGQGDHFVILTNADGAEDFKVVRTLAADPGRKQWRDEVPHEPGRLILAVVTFAEFSVRLERCDGLPRIVIRRRTDGEEHAIAFDEQAYSLELRPGFEYDTTKLRFAYSSMTTPQQTFEYDMGTRERVLLKTQEVPSGHDPADYRSARVQAVSHDGEHVPVSVLWHRETPIDGTAPLLLYGYGAYGNTIPASFATSRLSLVDRGFVYAIAHVRGSKTKGYAWYRRGKLLEKKNTFHDFIAAAEHLVEAEYTDRGRITIHGGSAGGMLVGAVANMRPDLWRAVLAIVPFVDVLTTMCDADLPLTPPEWPEWGNPLKDERAYDYIASYSPYDNVEKKPYPHILATAGLTDPRVTYWEPAKWVARHRELKQGDNLLLLRTYMEAGHGGSAGRLEHLREVALIYAFVLLANGKV